MQLAHKVTEYYRQAFGNQPSVFAAPGRVNIIGEHTDYNGGLVLPAAIDKAAYLAIGKAEGRIGRWLSLDFNDEVEINFDDIRKQEKSWPNYILGIIDQFRKQGCDPEPFNMVLAADIPVGAGLSSSAAIEAVTAYSLNKMNSWGFDLLDLAELAQRAEHEYIGVKVGIMDMFASLHGQQGHAMRLDCRSLEFEYYPLDLGQYKILLLDTGIKHELASTEYNVRRQQCEAGVAVVKRRHPEVSLLRDVTTGMLEAQRDEMDPDIYKRCYYVIEENKRVDQVCEALKQGSLDRVGQLMYESHAGLQHDYEVSAPELDLLVKLVKEETFVLGGRMMGGGFGGCTINIVHQDSIAPLISKIGPVYKENTGIELQAYEVVTGNGAQQVS